VKVHAGITIFDYTGNRRLRLPPKPEAVNRAKEFISKGLTAGNFTPKIDRVFNGLEQYQLAHQHMARNGRNGRIIVSLH
jgi:NADPH:quinone reductase-like Zn-dependent oxidoreductase